MFMKKITILILAAAVLLPVGLNAADETKLGSKILRFHESVSGMLVDTNDLKRILKNSRNVSRLQKGSYEIGLSLWNSPIFLIAGMEVEPGSDDSSLPDRRVMWNSALDQIDERYLVLPSLPPYEWARNRMRTAMPYRILFYAKSPGAVQVIKLELEGSLQRDLSIPLP